MGTRAGSRRRAIGAVLTAAVIASLGMFSGPGHAASGAPAPARAGGAHPVPQTYSIPAPPGHSPDVRQSAKAAQAAVTVKIHHYNICSGHDECFRHTEFRDNAINLASWFMTAEGGWFLSLNEVCRSDFTKIATRLQSAGTMVYAQRQNAECQGQPYGSAIIHPGGVKVDGKAEYFYEQAPDKMGRCDEPTVECRVALCLKLTTFAGPMTVCTAHLETGDVKDEQAGEYYKLATDYAGSDRKVLAGDFNMEPTETPDAYEGLWNLLEEPTFPLWHDHDRIDLTPPVAIKPTRRIDHIWIDQVGKPGRYQPYCPQPGHYLEFASDHCYTKGDWIL
jgi:hypothetical protein